MFAIIFSMEQQIKKIWIAGFFLPAINATVFNFEFSRITIGFWILTLWHNVQQSRPTVFQLGLHRINIGWVNWWGLLASTILQVWHLHHPQLFLVCKKGKLHVKLSPYVTKWFFKGPKKLPMSSRCGYFTFHNFSLSVNKENYLLNSKFMSCPFLGPIWFFKGPKQNTCVFQVWPLHFP